MFDAGPTGPSFFLSVSTFSGVLVPQLPMSLARFGRVERYGQQWTSMFLPVSQAETGRRQLTYHGPSVPLYSLVTSAADRARLYILASLMKASPTTASRLRFRLLTGPVDNATLSVPLEVCAPSS